MAPLLFANNATSTLAGSISNVATTCNLAPGTGALFPNPNTGDGEYFMLTFTDAATGLQNEIVKVTARSTDTLTIVRAQEGTSAQGWTAGDLASNLNTAGSMATLVQAAQLTIQGGIFVQDTGVANGPVIELPSYITSLEQIDGTPIRIRVAANNTGATTLTVTDVGAATLVTPDGQNLSGGMLFGDGDISVVYNLNNDQFVLQSITRTMTPYRGAQAILSGSGSVTLPDYVTAYKITLTGGGGGYGGGSVAGGAGKGGVILIEWGA